MTRELQEKKRESVPFAFSEDAAPRSRRARRSDMTPEIASEVQARRRAIGAELRRIFDNVANEPVPEEFCALMNQIDRKLKE